MKRNFLLVFILVLIVLIGRSICKAAVIGYDYNAATTAYAGFEGEGRVYNCSENSGNSPPIFTGDFADLTTEYLLAYAWATADFMQLNVQTDIWGPGGPDASPPAGATARGEASFEINEEENWMLNITSECKADLDNIGIINISTDVHARLFNSNWSVIYAYEPLWSDYWNKKHYDTEMFGPGLYYLTLFTETGLHKKYGVGSYYDLDTKIEAEVVPEPITILLLGIGALSLRRKTEV